METIQKNDFVEIEFTGFTENKIFDTTNKEEAKKIGIETNSETEIKPRIICVGNGMVIKGFDEALIGKEIGKNYSIVLPPEKAFGIRRKELVKIAPIKLFLEKNLNPYPGMMVQLDNFIAKILSVSGGRVSIDFNNPLAGKEIKYDFKILRKIEDDREKINSIQDFFFKKRFEFDIIKDEKSKNKKVVFKNGELKELLKIFSKKFKEMTGYDFEYL